jgi:hypothetical protein
MLLALKFTFPVQAEVQLKKFELLKDKEAQPTGKSTAKVSTKHKIVQYLHHNRFYGYPETKEKCLIPTICKEIHDFTGSFWGVICAAEVGSSVIAIAEKALSGTI